MVHPDNGILPCIEQPSHKITLRILKCILLRERSQFRKTIFSVIPTMWFPSHSRKVKINDIIMLVVGQEFRKREEKGD